MSLLEKLPQTFDSLPGGKGVTNAVDYVVNWARANSLWPLIYGTSCCAIEMMATGASKHDWSRFGTEVARATPRQADLIILAGTIVEKMGPRLRTLYEQMPSPKYVIAMGACTISGGPFYYDSYAAVKGADRIIPVDVYVPGCPPRPEALLYGIMQLQKLIKGESFRAPRKPNPLYLEGIPDIHTVSDDAWKVEEESKQARLKDEQAAFAAENPKYKGHTYERKETESFPVVDLKEPVQVGLANTVILKVVQEKFPSIKLFEIESATEEAVQSKGLDYTLDFEVDPAEYLSFINFLKTHAQLKMDFLTFLTAVDWVEHMDVVVHLQSTELGHKISIRSSLTDRESPEISTLSHIYPTANWHEREVYDFFGIEFENHPDMRRIFLDELEIPIEGFPLRKDWQDPTRVVKRPY